MPSNGPFKKIKNGTLWYFEGEDAEIKCRHEGVIELYPDWVRLGGMNSTWVPRERVEQVSER